MKQASTHLSRHQRRHGIPIPRPRRDPLSRMPHSRAILGWWPAALVILLLAAIITAL